MRTLLAILSAFLFPPLGVILGGGSAMSLVLNVVLTLFFWFPGVVHALYIIAKNGD